MSTTGQSKIRNCVTGHQNVSFMLRMDYMVWKTFKDSVDKTEYESLWIFPDPCKKKKKA